MRRDPFNTMFVKELIVEFIAMVSLVESQLTMGMLGKAAFYKSRPKAKCYQRERQQKDHQHL